jgi:ATP/maltotriose-dependent transcriptional regulator MalT
MFSCGFVPLKGRITSLVRSWFTPAGSSRLPPAGALGYEEGLGGYREELVTTKLRPPRTRPKLVARPRLRQALAADEGRKLTLVSAPAGFGKTTLLSEWLQSCAGGERSIVWVSLDEGDNDPARFLSYVVAALRTIEEWIGEDILASLRSPEPPRLEALVGALVNEMATLPDELAVVLDDYHVVDEQSVHGIVTFLLDNLPQGVQLVIASRVDPPLLWQGCAPGARWRSSAPPNCASRPRKLLLS